MFADCSYIYVLFSAVQSVLTYLIKVFFILLYI